MHCDLNCDMGEGTGNDEAIMPYISSSNIACGYHAGNETIMRQTILLCQKFNVAIGAHPSFKDRDNFGRVEIDLTTGEVHQLVTDQVTALKKIATAYGAVLHHVKPHGALYNLAARDSQMAAAIAWAVKDVDEKLIIYGLSGSCLVYESITIGLKTASEVFADRTYQDNGSLTPRTEPYALIEDEQKAVQQVLQMIEKGSVTSISGKEVSLIADTVCIHGDGKNAVPFAKKINKTLQQHGIAIQAI